MMNQKDFFANSPKKSRMIILNQTFNFHRKKHCTGKFSEVFFKKNIPNFWSIQRNLSAVESGLVDLAPAMLI